MGLNHCAYVDSKGGRHSSLHGMRELSLSNAPQTKPGFVDNLDATFVHDGTPKSFKMGAFTEWQEKQAQGLLARPDLQRMLTIPGSGLLYSLEGEAFLVTPLGEGVHMAKIGPVQPFFEGETPR
jgi:hypothetical protein